MTWHDCKLTHLIKIGPEIFMITTTIFYSFVCIYWTVYCLRIYYHSFESYCVVLSKYQKIMASFPFIFCWRKHVFWMIIQIFTENHFFSNVWTADSLNMVDPSFFSFLKDLHADNTLVTNKYTKNIKWVWMGLTDARWRIFLEIDEKLLTSAKLVKRIIFENNKRVAFQWGVIHPNQLSDLEIRAVQIGRRKSRRQQELSVIPYRSSKHRNFAKLLGNV